MHPRSSASSRVPFAVLAAAALAIALLAAARPATAGDRRWTPIGPDGGQVWALAVDPTAPNVVYAGAGTVFRSDDGGDSWTFAGAGLPPAIVRVRALVVHGGAVFAGTEQLGLWKSGDRGTSWQQLAGGLPPPPNPGGGPHVGALAADPRVPARLWAGTRRGVFFSDDGGATWTERLRGLPVDSPTQGLAIDPRDGRLYAANFRGVFTSTNDGRRWTRANKGLATGAHALLVDPGTTPSTVLAGTSLGIYRSRNQAGRWTRVGSAQVQGAVLSLARRGIRIIAGGTGSGIVYSDDHGETWAQAFLQPDDRLVFAVAAGPGAFYAGTFGEGNPGGVFRSLNEGVAWSPARSGLAAQPVDAIALHPTDPNVIYAGAGRRSLFETADGGATWDFHDLGLTTTAPQWLGTLLVDENPAVVLGGNRVGNGGLFLSHDSGASWLRLSLAVEVEALVRDPRNADAVWVAGFPGLSYSVNGADSWQRLPVPGGDRVWLRTFVVDPRDPRWLWAGGGVFEGAHHRLRLRLFRSADGGQTWERRESGIDGFTVATIAVDPNAPDTIYAGTDAGLYRSTNAGASWTQVLPGQFEQALALPATPTAVWAIGPSEVRHSTDGGVTWGRPLDGLFGASIDSLAADPTNPKRVFAGTTTRSILTWTD